MTATAAVLGSTIRSAIIQCSCSLPCHSTSFSSVYPASPAQDVWAVMSPVERSELEDRYGRDSEQDAYCTRIWSREWEVWPVAINFNLSSPCPFGLPKKKGSEWRWFPALHKKSVGPFPQDLKVLFLIEDAGNHGYNYSEAYKAFD